MEECRDAALSRTPAPAAEPVDLLAALKAVSWRLDAARKGLDAATRDGIADELAAIATEADQAIALYASPPQQPVAISREEIAGLLSEAFEAGCSAVHENFQPDPDPEFGEAARDYATDRLAKMGKPSPVVGEAG